MQDRHYRHWPAGVPRQFPLPETSLYYNLEVAAARYARKTAIFYYGGELAFACSRMIHAVAAAFGRLKEETDDHRDQQG